MKRLIAIIVLCLVSFVPNFAAAKQSASIEGNWDVTGKATISAGISGLLSVKANLSKNQDISDSFVFNAGALSTEKLGPVGTYTVSKSGKVTVDISNLMVMLQEELGVNLPSGSTISYPKSSCSIKLNGSNKFTGTLSLVIDINSTLNSEAISPAINIVCTLTGVRNTKVLAPAYSQTDAAKVISNFIAQKAIKPAISIGIIKQQ
jgi:hypothetical protein